MNVDDSTIEINSDTLRVKDAGITDAKISAVGVQKITSGAGNYLTYQPNGAACTDGQVLKWDNTNSRWDCDDDEDSSAGGADASSIRGETVKSTIATDTTTDGQVLTWSQTNSQWEVSTIDHDTLTNFVANEHIDHSLSLIHI